ncbi:hypothetical protein CCR75_009094 [Bremia lactucae]|uniref:Uncharacterized protein n=1 Tax=Bremia lactucae TaxID=4779 RepID=A0A976FPG3_BRELC|nr:hypothetical protein CCR75_009094 [Bremia lactucae]
MWEPDDDIVVSFTSYPSWCLLHKSKRDVWKTKTSSGLAETKGSVVTVYWQGDDGSKNIGDGMATRAIFALNLFEVATT